jgi:outer membrane protein insertion porin family
MSATNASSVTDSMDIKVVQQHAQSSSSSSCEDGNPFGAVIRRAEGLLHSVCAKWGPLADKAKQCVLKNKGLGRSTNSLFDSAASASAAAAVLSLPLCSASLSLGKDDCGRSSRGGDSGNVGSLRTEQYMPVSRGPGKRRGSHRRKGSGIQFVQQQVGEEEERVLISEILIQNKDGQNLEDSELLATAQQALKACKPNFALTTSEVQEDVHRIIDTGFFSSCMPSAEDTRDGVRLIFKVEPNQELKGLVCNGANVLPTRVVENAFRDEFGKVVNIQRLNKVLDTLNGWYRDRGLFGQVRLMLRVCWEDLIHKHGDL